MLMCVCEHKLNLSTKWRAATAFEINMRHVAATTKKKSNTTHPDIKWQRESLTVLLLFSQFSISRVQSKVSVLKLLENYDAQEYVKMLHTPDVLSRINHTLKLPENEIQDPSSMI